MVEIRKISVTADMTAEIWLSDDIMQVLRFALCNSTDGSYMKLEALWVIINLFCGAEDILRTP